MATASVPVLGSPAAGADLVTEAVAGERVEATGKRGDWYSVLVPSHRTSLDPRGYPGWVSAAAPLVEAEGWSPGLTVAAPNRAGLPLGALLEGAGDSARMADGRKAGLEDGETLPAGAASGLSEVGISRRLLGLPYRWGGTDSATGMDCSGMVYRVMQLRGIGVPRDADDQLDHAPYSSREHWENAREGDLVFFGEGSVTHVGFYLGDGTYISEHGTGGTMIRGMTEDPYVGFARYGG